MKKYLKFIFIGFISVSLFSCTKEADVNGISAKLPPISLSSLGLQEVSTFTATSIVQLQFGATTTSATPGAFKVELLDGTVVAKTIDFASWSGNDLTSSLPGVKPVVTNHTISFVTAPTVYPNTTAYQGTLLLKLTGLTAGKTYGVRATAYTSVATVFSTITSTNLIKVN